MGEREIARGMLADMTPVLAAATGAGNPADEARTAPPVAARPEEAAAEPAADPARNAS